VQQDSANPPFASAVAALPRNALPALASNDYQLLLDEAQTGLCIARRGAYLFVNRRLAQMLGYHVEELMALPATSIVHPADRPLVEQRIRERLAGVPGQAYDIRCVRKDGSLFDARVCGQRVVFDGEHADLVSLTDISEVKQAVRTAEWRARMLAQSEALCHSGSIDIDLTNGRVTLSVGMWELLGIVPPRTKPQSRKAMLQWLPADERQYVASIWRSAVPGEPFELQHRIVRADGNRRVLLQRGMVESGADGRALRGVAILQDITAQREAERRIQELANYDDVTGLPNRALLLDRVDEACREAGALALLAIDIEQVEQVKESIGFPAGDALAMALAARLRRTCSAEDLLAHLGGGQFALLIDPKRGGDERAVLDVVRAVQGALAEPECVANTDIFLSASIGVAGFPADGHTAQALLQAAHAAMCAAGEQGGGRVCFFTPQSNTRAARRLALESALRHAVQRGELVLHYQPQVDLHSGTMCGVEALLRWTHPTLGEISPGEFIPMAEQAGLIVQIGEWVLRQACLQSVAWQRAGYGALRVTINLSAHQLEQPDLVQRIQAVLLATGADPARLGIEVTESMLAADVTHAARTLSALRALGIRIALDDFGTGYSNLSHLRTLPIDVIKVDRSFVHDVTAAPADVSVTRAVITMAHSLQMKVLAEGVETEGQLALLVANGCDQMQGYYFSAGVSAAEIETLLRENRRLPERFIERRQRRRTLLIVDDEENIVAALKRLLRRDGYHIVTAYSAAEGLQRLTEVDVDVIVSDQRMPGMTGVEFLRRAKELYPDTVRMVLSGYTELQSITDAVNEGAIYKFLTKPWDDERLRAHIEEAFRQKEMADENRRLHREVQQANQELADVNQRLQRLLATQREQMSLEEGRAASAREVLEHLPAPIIGFDVEGLIAFVNRDAEALLPEGSTLLGRDAEEALPAALREVWRSDDGLSRSIDLSGRRFRAVCRAMNGSTRSRGKLLVITPDA